MTAGVYGVSIVGESYYQRAIQRLAVGDPVVIWHETDNAHSRRALRVDDADGIKIGYVPSDSWLAAVIIDERKPVSARVAFMDRAHNGLIGVRLNVMIGTEFPPLDA